jgi:hypothetical protein
VVSLSRLAERRLNGLFHQEPAADDTAPAISGYPCGGAILGRIMVAIAVAVGAQAPFWRTKSMIC